MEMSEARAYLTLKGSVAKDTGCRQKASHANFQAEISNYRLRVLKPRVGYVNSLSLL